MRSHSGNSIHCLLSDAFRILIKTKFYNITYTRGWYWLLLVLLIKMESKRKEIIGCALFIFMTACDSLFKIYMTSSDPHYIVFCFSIGDKKSIFKRSLANKERISVKAVGLGSVVLIFSNFLNSSLRIFLILKTGGGGPFRTQIRTSDVILLIKPFRNFTFSYYGRNVVLCSCGCFHSIFTSHNSDNLEEQGEF